MSYHEEDEEYIPYPPRDSHHQIMARWGLAGGVALVGVVLTLTAAAPTLGILAMVAAGVYALWRFRLQVSLWQGQMEARRGVQPEAREKHHYAARALRAVGLYFVYRAIWKFITRD